MSGLTLYEHTGELADALDRIDAQETVEEREAVLLEVMPIIEAQMAKVDRYCGYMAHLESREALLTAEIKRLQDAQRRVRRDQERLEQCAIRVMETFGKSELCGDTSTLKLKKNPPSLIVSAPDMIPDKYRIIIPQTTQIDNTAVKVALKCGEEVPGAMLVSKMSLKRS